MKYQYKLIYWKTSNERVVSFYYNLKYAMTSLYILAKLGYVVLIADIHDKVLFTS